MSLIPTQIVFLQRLLADRAKLRDASGAATFFAEHHRIGMRMGRRFEYRDQDFDRATALLTSLGLSLNAVATGGPRAQMSIRPGVSEKSGTSRPHTNSVAVRTAAGKCRSDGREMWVPGSGHAVLTVQEALVLSADVLLVVENFETFRALDQYRWIDFEEENVLAIYRGDQILPLRDAKAVIDARSEPVWAFFDFDPAGLGMAAALPRLERLVLPGDPWLTDAVHRQKRHDLFAQQLEQYERVLDGAVHPHVSRAWKRLRALKAGLPQEWMAAAETILP